MTNRGEFAIIAKLFSGAGARRLGSEKDFERDRKKGLTKRNEPGIITELFEPLERAS